MSAPDPKATVRWVLWGAFLVSHVFMAAVGRLSAAPAEALPPEQLQPVLIALAAAGVGALVFAIVVVPRQLAGLEPMVALILRFACAESVAIFGLVLALLGATPAVSLSFAAFGVLGHLLFAPTEADRRRRPLG